MQIVTENNVELIPLNNTAGQHNTSPNWAEINIFRLISDVYYVNKKRSDSIPQIAKSLLTSDFRNEYGRPSCGSPTYRPQFPRTSNSVIFFGSRSHTYQPDCSWEMYKNEIIEKLIEKGYENSGGKPEEQIFYASAKFDLPKMFEISGRIQSLKDVVKEGATPLLFMLKYGNCKNPQTNDCVKLLLEQGVDVNRCDFKGLYPFDYLAQKKITIPNHFKELIQLFRKYGGNSKIINENNSNIIEINSISEEEKVDNDIKLQLFSWIENNDCEAFLNFDKLEIYRNCDNGESTLLQFACSRLTDLSIVTKLLRYYPKEVTTANNNHSLLELAALGDRSEIFRLILKQRQTKFDEEQYIRFLNWSGSGIGAHYVKKILESNKTNIDWKSGEDGNSPLHEALFRNFGDASKFLLRRGASLHRPNKKGLRCLDIITSKDLENHLSDAICADFHKDLCEVDFKMKLDFHSFINETNGNNEVDFLYGIGKNPQFQYLLPHPLVNIFLNLKWKKIEIYFYILLVLQIVIFTPLSFLFYFSPNFHFITLLLIILNIVVKVIFLIDVKTLFSLVPLHYCVELLTLLTMIATFLPEVGRSFRGFVFLEMSVCTLLTLGYHPKIAKWSVMLQRVFKTFTLLSLFFIMPLVAFSLGFNVLFNNPEKNSFFNHFATSLFKSYLMIVGEFDAGNVQFDDFSAYFLFVCFIVGMAMVLMNFWTGVAVSDVEQIERHSEINAYKNILFFILFIDTFLKTKFNPLTYLIKCNKYNPDLFKNVAIKDYKDYKVLLNVNATDKHFPNSPKFPQKLSVDVIRKIKDFQIDKDKVSLEKIMEKIENLGKQ